MIKRYLAFPKKLINFIHHHIMPKGLWARSLLIIVIPLILLQLIIAIFFYEQHWQTISRRMANSIAGDLTFVIALMQKTDEENRKPLFDAAQRHLKIGFFFTKDAMLPEKTSLDTDSMVIYELSQALKYAFGDTFTIEEGNLKKSVNIYIRQADGLLTVTVPKKRFFSSTAYVFSAWMLGSSLLLFIVAVLFLRIQVRSIRRLAKAADSFGKGHDVENFKPEGALEVRQAAAAFLAMRDRIKRQLDERTTMLAGVSHDLRTPLTRMKLQLAMMRKNDALNDLKQDVQEMETMVEGYLSFARGEGKEPFQKVEVSNLVKEIVTKMRRNNANIDLHIEQKQELMLRPNDFSRCIANILGNAARYAKYTKVNIGVRNNFWEITVDDDGPGIPEKSRNEVFKAFFRLDASRNQQTGGVGLGLTITKDIVVAHGGEITLAESPLGGLRVRLIFPL
ncbi:MAG: HAMP domain-containing protein [Alphaproteobacteria bacterium]|nr:HAMP domain-containing protein [Alphaproteobacteria bacterium]